VGPPTKGLAKEGLAKEGLAKEGLAKEGLVTVDLPYWPGPLSALEIREFQEGEYWLRMCRDCDRSL
jgi:hypothetical protein